MPSNKIDLSEVHGTKTHSKKSKLSKRKLLSKTKLNWRVAAPIIAAVTVIGAVVAYKSFAATPLYPYQYSFAVCQSSQPSDVQACTDKSAEALVYRLYKAAFNHKPDDNGYKYYVQKLAGDRLRLDGFGSEIANSPELNYAELSDVDFIKRVYDKVVGHAANSNDIALWQGKFNDANQVKEANPRLVMIRFAAGVSGIGYDDAVNRVGNDAIKNLDDEAFFARVYDKVAGKSISAADVTAWKANFKTAGEKIEADPRGVMLRFAAGTSKMSISEATKRISAVNDDKSFVERIYKNGINRSADQSGLDYWTKQLSSGRSRGQVLAEMMQGNEAIATNRGAVANYLNSAPRVSVTQTALFAQKYREAEVKKLVDASKSLNDQTAALWSNADNQVKTSAGLAGQSLVGDRSILVAISDRSREVQGYVEQAKTKATATSNNLNQAKKIAADAAEIAKYSPDLSDSIIKDDTNVVYTYDVSVHKTTDAIYRKIADVAWQYKIAEGKYNAEQKRIDDEKKRVAEEANRSWLANLAIAAWTAAYNAANAASGVVGSISSRSGGDTASSCKAKGSAYQWIGGNCKEFYANPSRVAKCEGDGTPGQRTWNDRIVYFCGFTGEAGSGRLTAMYCPDGYMSYLKDATVVESGKRHSTKLHGCQLNSRPK